MIFKFLKSLTGVASKSEVLEVVDGAKATMMVINGSYEHTSDIMEGVLSDSDVEKILKTPAKILKKSMGAKTVMDALLKALDNVDENIEFVEDKFKKLPSNVILSSLGVRDANMVSDINNIEFLADYTDKLFNLITVEVFKSMDLDKEIGVTESKKDKAFINDHLMDFKNVLDTICLEPRAYAKKINSYSDIVVGSEDEEAMLASTRVEGLNNAGMNNFYYSPFHGIARYLADIRASRYHYLKERLRELELYKSILEANKKGMNTTVLQKELELTQSRIDDLEYKISKEEE